MYPYGIIGNCQVSALISQHGSMDWCCLPRPDSPPIFGKLLDPDGGCFEIAPVGREAGEQKYLENTNILQTTFTDKKGNAFTVTDFAPRFEQYGRMFRPTMFIRIVQPVSGHPQIRVTCAPVNGWSKEKLPAIRGNSHIRFEGLQDQLRLTTNTPLTYLLGDLPFTLSQPLYFALTWGGPLQEDIETVATAFLQKTTAHWRTWIKHCSIPPRYQAEVIRSALALKLHCYEDTGAILAAVTSSLPEEIGSERNWDYRFCWLRDAYFTVSAFYKLGHFEEMEGILNFLFNILQQSDPKDLSPVYRVDGSLPLPELTMANWAGFGSSQPVRVGNQAAEHIQNDAYGEMLLTLCPLYFDERFSYLRAGIYDEMLHILARKCFECLNKPDAGLWEHRDGWKVHSFTSLCCWAGLERYTRLIQEKRLSGDLAQAEKWLAAAEETMRKAVKNNILWNAEGEENIDASALLLAKFGFRDKKLIELTIAEIQKSLGLAGRNKDNPTYYFRYKRTDDFGIPQHAFLICTFWMIEALAKVGKREQASQILDDCLNSANPLGLFAEHYDSEKHQQTGNFPQCYSHVGLIHSAFAVSPSWDDLI